ncbi:dihydrodipicolinate synthase family protein [Dehalococcoidia bacterium]|nr:dihydrodipicolinate synthase family protein [Dehalococcoidia bacterium]
MNREELKDLIKGTIVTTPTPFDNQGRLDLARTADVTRWWIGQGLGTNVAPLKVAAAGGEGPDMTDDEWQHLLRTTVNSAGSGAVVMCGLKAKSTMHTIEDAKIAQDLGAIGLQIDLPFFHHPNQDDYVRFYTDISDAIDIGIMIYNTYWFGAPSITPETMLRLKNAEQVVAVKWNTPEGQDYDQMREFSHIFNVIDNSGQTIRCYQNGGRGHISSTATAYSRHDLDLYQMLVDGRYKDAQSQLDRVRKPNALWREKSTAKSGGYRHLKAYMMAVDQGVGQPRLPTLPVEREEVDELKTIFRQIGWLPSQD